jgi:hypothetical protein
MALPEFIVGSPMREVLIGLVSLTVLMLGVGSILAVFRTASGTDQTRHGRQLAPGNDNHRVEPADSHGTSQKRESLLTDIAVIVAGLITFATGYLIQFNTFRTRPATTAQLLNMAQPSSRSAPSPACSWSESGRSGFFSVCAASPPALAALNPPSNCTAACPRPSDECDDTLRGFVPALAQLAQPPKSSTARCAVHDEPNNLRPCSYRSVAYWPTFVRRVPPPAKAIPWNGRRVVSA